MNGQSTHQAIRAHGAAEAARAALAYAVLALGVAGTVSIVPLIIWGLAVRGFH